MAAEWSDIMKKNKNSSSIEKRMVRQYLVLVLPGMIIFTIGLIIPLILSFRYSLTDWDGMTPEKTFVGIQNYIKLCSCVGQRDPCTKSVSCGIFYSMSDQCGSCRLGMAENVLQRASCYQ